MNTFIDAETIPRQPEEEAKIEIAKTIKPPAQMKKKETIEAWHAGEGNYAGVKDQAIEDAYRATSFDGAKGQICSLAFAVEDGEIFATEAGQKDERLILQEFCDGVASQMNGRPPFWIGHYISGFDLRFLFQRLVVNKVSPPFGLYPHGRHGAEYFDTMIAWAGYKGSISQENLCKALGIDGKPDGIDGSKVWEFYKAGKHDEIREYNIDDVDKVRQIFNRINFI